MYLKKTKKSLLWLKRKVVVVIAAIMLGISNSIYEEENIINGDYIKTEKKQEKNLKQ